MSAWGGLRALVAKSSAASAARRGMLLCGGAYAPTACNIVARPAANLIAVGKISPSAGVLGGEMDLRRDRRCTTPLLHAGRGAP